ncbi:MAG TPA: choloylglycine hydrolase, partial [Porphyromonadaceae bacterium]|nr:choloylglycine hydrolase [Porphyromonadaceae bacterium]
MDANLWVFPRGMERSGEVGPLSTKWTSKYGSIIASAWDIATADGMNEKGLVANILWLVESEYPTFDPQGTKQGISISLWAQYVLDNFATVEEAVNQLKGEPFVVVSDYVPGTEKFTTLHLSLSDAQGDNAIFEYIDGKLVIHHDPSYVVMTNSPVFEQQLALNEYWKGIPGTVMLPGTNRAADRFVRASYYIHAIPQSSDIRTSVASVFSV